MTAHILLGTTPLFFFFVLFSLREMNSNAAYWKAGQLSFIVIANQLQR
jgi:hypothetical protein